MIRFLKNIFLLLIFAFGIIGNNHAQKSLPSSRIAKKYYNKGIDKFRKGDFDNAIKYFEKTLEKEPDFVPAYYQLAGTYYKKNDYKNCEKYYKESLNIDSTFNNQVFYSLGVVLEKQGKLRDALVFYKKFLSKTKKEDSLFKKTKLKIKNLPFRIFAIEHPVKFDPVSVGSGINTLYNEYLPVLTGDNKKMIFTRRVVGNEDFYNSVFKDGKWQPAVELDDLNTLENEGAHTWTPDGKILIFTFCGRGRTYGSCDLVQSKYIEGEWTKPQNLGLKINTKFWESQPSISADGKFLYFVSNRPGCVGGEDIWVSKLDSAGEWQYPVCLDTTINTTADENSPYIHPDGKTLYFSSSGHQNMGGSDIFLSRKINGKWTTAKNLGYPINTENNEGALFITLDGSKAFFSTDRDNKKSKNLDIFYFETDDKIKPNPVTYVKGFVFDRKSGEKLNAKIFLYDNNKNEKIYTIETQKDTFLIPLPVGIDYNFTVDKEGYLFYSGRFKLDSLYEEQKPFELEVPLDKVENKKSNSLVLNNIFFQYNSAKLDTVKSNVELQNVVKLLKENPKINIMIIGHTDNIGNDKFNKNLSIARARSIYNYIISKGIDKNRLEYTGKGESAPLYDNSTEEGRRKNRRVELKIKT
ncbi:MAG TPA: tetratricopeptide repeat protein [Bacteroidetes bacterium]|nr:tetratricopeptide repeat protein [Bacteroidota bacterium]